MKTLRRFKSPQEFESITGIRLMQPIYLRNVISDSRVYIYAPYLGYKHQLTVDRLIIGSKQYNLDVLFATYEYSTDGKSYHPFGVEE